MKPIEWRFLKEKWLVNFVQRSFSISLSYLLLCNKLPPTQPLNTIHTYCLTVCKSGAQIWLSWDLCSGPLMRLQSRCQPQLGSHVKAQLGEALLSSSLSWLLAGLRSFWAFGLRASVSSWILDRSHPQFLAMWTSPIWQLASSKPARGRVC